MKSIAIGCALLACAAACADPAGPKADLTVVGITTVDQEQARAQDQLDGAVALLEKLVERPGTDGADLIAKLLAALPLLDEEVQRVRDRATAMDLLRDEYLRQWLEQTASLLSPETGKQAEERKTRVMAAYLELIVKGTTLKTTYAPLQASLRDCGRFLDADSRGTRAKGLAPELGKVRQGQKDVDQATQDFRNGLRAIVDLLSPPITAPPSRK